MSDHLFIYFDHVPAYGVLNGAIQVELTANLIRLEGSGTRTEIVDAGHLRCSPAAAFQLIAALQSALELAQKQATEQTPQTVN